MSTVAVLTCDKPWCWMDVDVLLQLGHQALHEVQVTLQACGVHCCRQELHERGNPTPRRDSGVKMFFEEV